MTTMALRGVAALGSFLLLATACTAVLGVEDVPPDPAADAAAAPGADGGDPAADRAVELEAYATAYCTRYKDCQTFDFDYNYKDVDECKTGFIAVEAWGLALPGVVVTADTYKDCAARMAALTCDRFASQAPTVCTPKGTRQASDKCLSNAQCASGFCGSDETSCRTCVAPPDNGAPCAAGDLCGPGLVCTAAGTCVTQATQGQGCSDDKPCAYPLQCLNSTCAPRTATAGAPCGGANGACDTTKGFVCVDGTCKTYTISAPGSPCGDTGSSYRACRRNTACTGGVCSDYPKEGDACDLDKGPNCLFPLRCVNNKCVGLPASSTCE
jgi:hypothetical protein